MYLGLRPFHLGFTVYCFKITLISGFSLSIRASISLSLSLSLPCWIQMPMARGSAGKYRYLELEP